MRKKERSINEKGRGGNFAGDILQRRLSAPSRNSYAARRKIRKENGWIQRRGRFQKRQKWMKKREGLWR